MPGIEMEIILLTIISTMERLEVKSLLIAVTSAQLAEVLCGELYVKK
jgi:hypothetical protein